MVQIKINYSGDLHCEANHGPSGQSLTTDAPVDNQGRGESFSPTDLVATALGTCLVTIMGIVGRDKEIDITGTKVTVDKEMAADPERRIGSLAIKIEFPRNLSTRERRILEATAIHCPVHKSLHPDVKVPLTFIYPED